MADQVNRILIVEKGFGASKLPLLQAHLRQDTEIQIPVIPEPTDDLNGGVEIVISTIKEFKPDVLIGSSRGGKVIGKLLFKI